MSADREEKSAEALDREAEFLGRVGARVRSARTRLGMSRKMLAQASGVSERYLAQLENGAGNISILLLRQLSQAMSVPLGDLIAEGPEKPIEGQEV
ncbi:MAG: helix-turn-helix domain-containing protein [Limibacillus sp.]